MGVRRAQKGAIVPPLILKMLYFRLHSMEDLVVRFENVLLLLKFFLEKISWKKKFPHNINKDARDILIEITMT